MEVDLGYCDEYSIAPASSEAEYIFANLENRINGNKYHFVLNSNTLIIYEFVNQKDGWVVTSVFSRFVILKKND